MTKVDKIWEEISKLSLEEKNVIEERLLPYHSDEMMLPLIYPLWISYPKLSPIRVLMVARKAGFPLRKEEKLDQDAYLFRFEGHSIDNDGALYELSVLCSFREWNLVKKMLELKGPTLDINDPKLVFLKTAILLDKERIR